MTDKQIQGVIVPMLTPLNPDETVDVPSLRSLVNYLIDNGVHGIWASGTTGEFANLPDSERIRSMEAVVDEVAGRVPVIGNISSTSTQMSVSLAQEVSELGMDGIALTPPYYYPDSQDELMDHYRYTRDSVGVPLWVYNIPQTVKTAVEPSTIAAHRRWSQGQFRRGRTPRPAQRPLRPGRDIPAPIPGHHVPRNERGIGRCAWSHSRNRQSGSGRLRARLGGGGSRRYRHRPRVQRDPHQVPEGRSRG